MFDVPLGSLGAFCAGHVTASARPCGDGGASGLGCANSVFAPGARLAGSGGASVSSDGAALTVTNATESAAVFAQGTEPLLPAIVDDGGGCVGGPVVRLGTVPVVMTAGASPRVRRPHRPCPRRGASRGGARFYRCS